MRYERPESLDQASAMLAAEAGIARILAGGTDVLVQMKSEVVEPDLIVDLKHLDGMRDIRAEDGGFRIGAAVSGAELNEHEGVCALWPGVAEALDLIGSTQVQGRATMIGNLCNGSPAADSVPALFAADAVVRVHGPEGVRDVPVQEIPKGPGKTSLGRGDIITSVFLPARPEGSGDAYLRFIPRTEMDIAVASAGVSLTVDANGVITTARVAVGAVAPTVRLADAAADAIVGTDLNAGAVTALRAAVEAVCSPIDDKRGTVAFRTSTAGVLAQRAAAVAYDRARG
ncbi:xanthine dehydrogenase family protein subunit M [uncultured Roseobacter sp.]|uniref:FAD binding domain-containing protein n=1 Tax=uncultured Roseobacter sp. TaxID=114847 RepID=UPI0026351E83|nr:xanthine dehydrogenase family protein subunit M [uncultured Roseobacter sp.]